MGFEKNKEIEFTYEYDFDVDGGAVSAIPFRAIGNALTNGVVIENASMYIVTDLVGASATAVVGNTVDADGYFVDIMTASVLDTVINTGNVAGALIWDNTNDVNLHYVIPSTAAAVPLLTVGTAALTAGKIKLVFKCRRY